MGSFVSERVNSIPVSGIRVIFEKANKMPGVIRLEVGEPDFDTPAHITAAAKRALDEGFTHYTSSAGIMPLREAISAKLKRENRVDADPATEVVVTPGAGAAIYLSIMCTVNPGDEVLLPDPAWPHYEACISLAGGKVVRYPTHESLGFRPEMEEVANLVTKKTKAILINSPSNPTGSVLGRKDLEGIADLARSKDLLVFSDEVYEKVMYGGVEHYSIASFDGMKDRTVTVNALSKTYAMTGWRVGYAAARPEIAAQMAKLNLFTSGCPNSFAQVAAVEALTGPQGETQRMLEEYTRRRDMMVRRLNEMEGVSCPNPGGAFYAFPRVALRGMNAFDTSMFLLDNAKVATVPGSSFGELGEKHLRLSYATSIENISEGMDRIDTAIRGAPRKESAPEQRLG
ncbi:MAG: pyridoxal phosphate-dependent aminotransferase [Thaumarchaeota archaeon]|nr:pyridoxal phosphate-dependent aminotransferase [Nitrososphaerota archaeon]